MSATTGRPQTRPNTPENELRRAIDRKRYYLTTGLIGWAKTALTNAKRRARRRGIQCTLTLDDVLGAVRKYCPILNVPLQYARGQRRPVGHSASIDRIDNTGDYCPGNISIISHRANMLKGNCTPDELIAIGKYANLLKSRNERR